MRFSAFLWGSFALGACGAPDSLEDAASTPAADTSPPVADAGPPAGEVGIGWPSPGEPHARMDWRDVAAIRETLEAFSTAYNAGDYPTAIAAFADRIVRECGGAEGLAAALARNHAEQGINYGFYEIEPWRDDPLKADVIVIERWNENQIDMPTGIAFAPERGGWRFDQVFPVPAAAYCD